MQLINSKFNIQNLILVLSLILVLISSCEKPTSPPPLKHEQDTTSQDFSFETYEFGDGFHTNWLNDVWIFNKNNAWAVGYIQCDTVSNANILRWNGKEWYVHNLQGTSSGISGIWAFDSTHIYFAAGGIIEYINGEFTFKSLDGYSNGQSIDHIWGSSLSNIWGVGRWGAIVHYNGKEWEKVDFDMQWYFVEITGSKESGVAYAVGQNTNATSIIVELKPTSQTIIYSRERDSIPPRAVGIMSLNKNHLNCSSDNIWQLDLETSEYEILKDFPSGYGLFTICGTSPNDIYYFGNDRDVGEKLIHFNGVRYKEFLLLDDFLMYKGSYAIKDFAIYVGRRYYDAYIKMIRRR